MVRRQTGHKRTSGIFDSGDDTDEDPTYILSNDGAETESEEPNDSSGKVPKDTEYITTKRRQRWKKKDIQFLSEYFQEEIKAKTYPTRIKMNRYRHILKCDRSNAQIKSKLQHLMKKANG